MDWSKLDTPGLLGEIRSRGLDPQAINLDLLDNPELDGLIKELGHRAVLDAEARDFQSTLQEAINRFDGA